MNKHAALTLAVREAVRRTPQLSTAAAGYYTGAHHVGDAAVDVGNVTFPIIVTVDHRVEPLLMTCLALPTQMLGFTQTRTSMRSRRASITNHDSAKHSGKGHCGL